MTIYFCNYISMLLINEPLMGSKNFFMERTRTNFLGSKLVKDGYDWNSEAKVTQVSF